MQITKNNSVLPNVNLKFQFDEKQSIMALASDKKTGTILAGTNASYILHFQLKNNSRMELTRQHSSQKQTNVNSIQCMNTQKDNKFIVGLANGCIRIYNCEDANIFCEIQAHSRSINSIICHRQSSIFATVSDDTLVNLWYVQCDEEANDV